MSSNLLNFNLDLQVGNIYTFNTIAPAILQATYSDAKLIAKGDYDLAISYANINALHSNIYPLLINTPSGTSIYPNDPKAYEYYIFKLPSNLKIALQSAWIVADTIQLVTGLYLTVTVNNLGSYNDVTRILNAIALLGYTNISSAVNNAVAPTSPATGTTSTTSTSSTSSTTTSSTSS